MRLLVTGANGFIGSAIVESLLASGHSVIAVGRSVPTCSNHHQLVSVQKNLLNLTHQADWLPLLENVEGVINCAGILRANPTQQFDTIHVKAPLALAKACIDKGIDKFIQISALGDPDDGEFISSKHRFDHQLLDLMPNALVLRPSVVVSLRGSYGGTSMLRGLSAVPEFLLLPGKGEQLIQPIMLEDLAKLVVEAVSPDKNLNGIIEVGGPEQLSIKEFLEGLRAWLKFPTRATIFVPDLVIKTACLMGDKFKAGPLNRTILALLESGNIVNEKTGMDRFDYKPQSLMSKLQTQASFVQDRWHARLFLLQPIIWLVLTVIWLLSALAGFSADTEQFSPILLSVGFPERFHFSLVMFTSVLDLALGACLLVRFKERIMLWLMLMSTLGYSLLLGSMAPELWLDPLGGLLKNLAILPLLLTYMVMRNAR